MKKTLIALVALSSVAMAGHTSTTRDLATLSTDTIIPIYSAGLTSTLDKKLSGSNESITFGTTTALSSYIFTFAFDTLPNANKDAVIRTSTAGSNNNTSALSVVSRSSSDGVVLTFCRGDATTAGTVFGGTLAANTTDTFALTVYTAADDTHTLYLSNLSTHELITVTEADIPAELTYFDMKSGTARVFSASGSVSIVVGQVGDLTGLSADMVKTFAATGAPEPATATLSLLALAGLAARRKRH